MQSLITARILPEESVAKTAVGFCAVAASSANAAPQRDFAVDEEAPEPFLMLLVNESRRGRKEMVPWLPLKQHLSGASGACSNNSLMGCQHTRAGIIS